jgi:hypothetical protein
MSSQADFGFVNQISRLVRRTFHDSQKPQTRTGPVVEEDSYRLTFFIRDLQKFLNIFGTHQNAV